MGGKYDLVNIKFIPWGQGLPWCELAADEWMIVVNGDPLG